MRNRKAYARLLASCVAFAFAAPCTAQAVPEQSPPPTSPSGDIPGAAETGDAQLPSSDKASPQPADSVSTPPGTGSVAAGTQAGPADIVVTGSRVIKNGSASPTPLTTISSAALAVASPTGTIADALNNLPVFSGSRGQFSNPGANATGVQGGNGAANVLNLRNLGFYRTLPLFDGHRIPPTLYNSAVDVDLIPQELIDRVDIVTGGVSAVYGSDAISGVVNYVLNRKFEGFRAHSEFGISQHGDAAYRNFGASYGVNVGSRGHFEASVQRRVADGILDRAYARKWDNLAAIQGAGTAANPYYLATNVHLSGYTFGGLVTSRGAFSGQQFGAPGVLVPFVAGAASGSSCCQIGGDGAYQNGSMISPSRATQVFARFDYDLTDDILVYVQGAGNFKKNISYNGWNVLQGLTFSGSNAFLSPAAQAGFAAAGQSTFTLNEIINAAPRIRNSADTRQYYINAGVEGDLGKFKWDATYTHGASRLDTQVQNLPNNQKLAAALDAVVNPANGQIACRASLTNPAQYGDCVPLNIFGSTAPSQQALAYVLGNVDFLTHTIQDSADASISGSPFDTWAGPLTVALSGEWRRQSFDARSSASPTQYIDCTGLRYNCTATTTIFPITFPNSDKVSQSVKEVAFETNVPLLRDVRFAKSFDLNGAVRYTDYSTSGKYVTWKIGAVWSVDDQLKFRGTVSRDIRAPTLYDLFQPTTIVPGLFTDTLTGQSVYVPSINDGNVNLKSEIGRTYTAGAVLKPRLVPGLTLTVDYYHTTISNAISTVQGFNAAIQAACYSSNGTSPYCSLIQRNAAGQVTAFYIQPQNIAKVRTYGIDGEVDYATRLFGRQLGLRALVNYQPHIYYEQPGVATIDQGGAGWGQNGLMPSPSVQVAGFLNYRVTDAITLDVFEHYRNGFRRSGVASQVFLDPHVGDYATTNLTVTFDTGSLWRIANSALSLSVTNLFNATPPLSGYYSGTTSAGQAYEFSDDPTGRAFVVGFRIRT